MENQLKLGILRLHEYHFILPFSQESGEPFIDQFSKTLGPRSAKFEHLRIFLSFFLLWSVWCGNKSKGLFPGDHCEAALHLLGEAHSVTVRGASAPHTPRVKWAFSLCNAAWSTPGYCFCGRGQKGSGILSCRYTAQHWIALNSLLHQIHYFKEQFSSLSIR